MHLCNELFLFQNSHYMEPYQQKIIESIVVILLYIIVKRVSVNIVNKTLLNRDLLKSRGDIIKNAINVFYLLLLVILLCLIWGVDQSDLLVFLGSVLTIIGVAFFAQWSLLSNITSSIIIFFNHRVRINDKIAIMEGKDYVIEGKVSEIGLFFTTIVTVDDEELTLPNNIFIQKSIKKINELKPTTNGDKSPEINKTDSKM